MKDIVVVGVGGTSREILELLESINAVKGSWNILGFVDDNPALEGLEVSSYPVLGTTNLLSTAAFQNTCVVVGIANDRQLLVREDMRRKLELNSAQYPTLIHPSAVVSNRAKLAEGAIIMAGVFCAGNVRIGAHVIVLPNSVIGHDVQIEDFASISASVAIAGGALIDKGAYLGLGSAIMPGCRVGREAIVGIGAVVMRDVTEYTTVAGNPARVIAHRPAIT